MERVELSDGVRLRELSPRDDAADRNVLVQALRGTVSQAGMIREALGHRGSRPFEGVDSLVTGHGTLAQDPPYSSPDGA